MTDPGTQASPGRQPGPGVKALELMIGLTMAAGRGRAARTMARAAGLTAGDRVADIGCGPGNAVRQAARLGASATGIDPSPSMLWLARRISAITHARRVSWLEGRAEAIPMPDEAVTVVWALSSVHHWDDQAAGLSEIHRVLAPGGRVLLTERQVRPGARGLAAHGLTSGRAEDLARTMTDAGFTGVRTGTRRAGRRTLITVAGQRASA